MGNSDGWIQDRTSLQEEENQQTDPCARVIIFLLSSLYSSIERVKIKIQQIKNMDFELAYSF
jgi:hypothetical protein